MALMRLTDNDGEGGGDIFVDHTTVTLIRPSSIGGSVVVAGSTHLLVKETPNEIHEKIEAMDKQN